MHATAAQSPWKRIGFPLLFVVMLLFCVLAVPLLSIPLSLIMPLIVCPAQVSIGLWFALIVPIIPCVGLVLTGADLGLCLCLLPCAYLCLLVQLMTRRRKLQFSTTMLWSTAAVMVAQTLIWARVAALLDGDIFGGLSGKAVDTLALLPNSGNILYQLVTSGLLALPTRFQNPVAYRLGEYLFIEPALRAELLNTLRHQLYDWLLYAIPSLLVQASIFIGLLTTLQTERETARRSPKTLLIIHRSGKREMKSNAALLPSFQTLRLPKAYEGYVLFLAVASLVLLLFEGAIASLMSTMMLSAFSFIYSLLGAAVLIYLLGRKHPNRGALHAIIAAALYLVFPTALFLLGLLDQFMGLRSATLFHQEEDE